MFSLPPTKSASGSMSSSPDTAAKPQPQAWFCTTGLPSDVVVEAGTTTFHLHKFPLVSRSRRLQILLIEDERASLETEIVEIGRADPLRVFLPDIPGGAAAFESVAKFCYGVRLDLSPSTVVPIRCAAEFLDMSDDLVHGNLSSRCDRYLQSSVLRSLRGSVLALRSACAADVSAAAEALGITQRLVDAIAARACSSSLFGWPVVSDARQQKTAKRFHTAAESWLDELTTLTLPAYKQVVVAMEARGVSSDLVEASLVSYARRSIRGLSRLVRRTGRIDSPATETEQLELVETVIAHLPQRRGGGASSTRFLFGLLRVANIVRASDAARELLERRIALQLDQATLDDLLIPSFSSSSDDETLYDVGCVERLVVHFTDSQDGVVEEEDEAGNHNPMVRVGRLVDGYLSEVASDSNLDVERFCSLAFAVPVAARVYDDGLYRAVDIYLKAHPRMSDGERERVCGMVDCRKLTVEACTHAAQNERLPLRAVVQVLFFEQLQLRHAIAAETLQLRGANQHEGEQMMLRLDMDGISNRVHRLERQCSSMKRAIRKVAHGDAAHQGSSPVGRRFGCKFATEVCHSHERNIVEASSRLGEQSA